MTQPDDHVVVPNDEPTLSEALASALEAARLDVIDQLGAEDFPTTLELNRMVVIDNDERTGWQTQWQMQQVSGLHDRSAQMAIRDPASRFAGPSFTDQLRPLAERLNEQTDLGTPCLGIGTVISHNTQPGWGCTDRTVDRTLLASGQP